MEGSDFPQACDPLLVDEQRAAKGPQELLQGFGERILRRQLLPAGRVVCPLLMRRLAHGHSVYVYGVEL